MDKLIIYYQDADEDTFNFNIEGIQELQKWLIQHPSDIYYLKNKQFQTTYKLYRVAKCPLKPFPKLIATDREMSEKELITKADIIDFIKTYNCSEYYLEINYRVFVIHPT